MVDQDMRIGALTACAPTYSLREWMSIAADMGLDGLEVAAHPSGGMEGRKDWVANTIDLTEGLTQARAEEIRAMSSEFGIAIHSLGCYQNMLHPETGQADRDHLKKVIDAASLLGVGYVGTFVGADPSRRMQENLDSLFPQFFVPLLQYAQEKGVKIMVENCPMEGWMPRDLPVNQMMSSPRCWTACFEIADKAGVGDVLGLEYDPSHRIWQLAGNMDLVAKDVELFGSHGKIFALHGKGAEFRVGEFYEDGIEPRLIGLDHEWAKRSLYEHAVPGQSYDSVQWDKVISTARKHSIPFISIEIEDPNYKDMNDPVRSGQLGVEAVGLARDHLKDLCYANKVSYQAKKD